MLNPFSERPNASKSWPSLWPPRRRLTVNKVLLAVGVFVFVVAASVFVYYYVRFARMIDARLNGEIFNNASVVYAAPSPVIVGQPATPEDLAARLRKAAYAEGEGVSRVGTYKIGRDRLEIYPGPRSFFQGDTLPEGPAAFQFREGRIESITALDRMARLDNYWLEPEVLTTLFDQSRTKRRLVRFQDLPKSLIDALLATEDHRFFAHHGVNIYRIVAAAIADLRAEEKLQGGSTLTMQLARNFFLTPRRTIRRKMAEIFLALLLEQRLSKEQILELYANQVYLGQRGSFSIYGFGEGASAYFNKDLSSLSLPEAALLAGLIRGPNLYSPYKYPNRALDRRNFVLRRMVETNYIKPEEAEKSAATPLTVTRQNAESTQAPFFVDMVKDQLLLEFTERELLSQSYRIYTTLDLDLQRVASEGVRAGLAEVDESVKRQKRAKGSPPPDPNQPQVALVAFDPHTGAVTALVGGRDYGLSQLNHVLARRQPGSSFKPFVYAAALNTAVDGTQPVITPATTLVDEPTTFQYGGQPYEPENYKQEYHGLVTVREALTHSLNVATVRLGEMVGFEKVKELAVEAGINRELLPTPALALGAYVATPLEVAGAYTIFANGGQYVAPRIILAVEDSAGHTLWRSPSITRRVLDPRVSYLMVSLMESVLNNGTGVGVRSRGFTLPAAGKTGTSHDGWFSGFTSNLLAVVWIGYDDDRELKLSGAGSGLPVWTEFMKRATLLPAYQDCQPFVPPPGIVSAPVDPPSNPAGSGGTLTVRNELFIEGTEPRPDNLGGGIRGILGRIFRSGENREAVPAAVTTVPPTGVEPGQQPPAPEGEAQSPPKREGIMKKFLHIFKGGESKPQPQPPPPPQPPPKSNP